MSSKILIHTCCAPCLIWPQNLLKEKGFQVAGFFYNPNIHPQEEYQRRRDAVEKLSQINGAEMIYPGYDPNEYYQAIGNQKEGEERCFICWSLRLQRTALNALERGFSHFTTTLLVSPHQDQDSLKKIGQDISAETGVPFYWEDFRSGYRLAHQQAKAEGIYCQKYCGCEFSLTEKNDRKHKVKR